MNVTLANTINFAKDSLNLAKETAVNYGGWAITQLKHLPVTMHEDFRVACGVTATVTAVALIVGECFGEYVWKKVDGNNRKPASEVVKRLVFTATLASAYAGLSYATGFPQSKTVSALIVVSFTAIRCLVSALDWQKTSIGYLEGQDTLREEKNTLQTTNNKLKKFNSNFIQENSILTERNKKANSGYQEHCTNLQAQIDAFEQENLRLTQELNKKAPLPGEGSNDLSDYKSLDSAKNTPLPEENEDDLLD
jgi:hypothetical protein